MPKRTKETITLGSGEYYIDDNVDSIPEAANLTGWVTLVSSLCADAEKRIGRSQGGASIEYTQETYEEKDDLGFVSKIITTDEEALMKAGLLTWNANTFPQLIDRCKVTEVSTGTGASTKNYRIAQIGGKGNEQGKYYVICFQHTDTKDGNIWVAMVGRNTAGMTLSFAKDSATKIEPEFKAIPHDEAGTLIVYIEELDNGLSA